MTSLGGTCLIEVLQDFVEGDAHVSAGLSLTASQLLDIVLVLRAVLLVLQRVVAARFLKEKTIGWLFS